MRRSYVLILFFVLSFLNSQLSYSQEKYEWLNIPDSVVHNKQLLTVMKQRIRQAAVSEKEHNIEQIIAERQRAERDGDTLKISCGYYILASLEDYSGNYPQSIALYKNSASYLRNSEHIWFIATLYSKIAYALSRISEYDSALVYYSKSLEIREATQNKLGVINTKNFIGNVYKRMGSYDKAFDYYTEALSLIPDTALNKARAFTFVNIGSVFIETGNLKLAEKFYLDALHIRENFNSEFLIGHSYNKLARLYYVKGNIDLSIEYCLRSVSIFNKREWKKTLPGTYNLLGLCYLSKKEFRAAHEFFDSSRKIAEKEINRIQLAENAINLGKLYLETQEYKIAIEHLQRAIELGEQIKSQTIIIDANYIIADAYFYDKQYKQAFLAQKEYEKLKNELFNSGFAEKVASFVSSRELEKANVIFEMKQKERELIERSRIQEERLLKNIYLIASLIFLIFVFVLYRNFKLKVRRNKELAKYNQQIVKKQQEILAQKNSLELQKKELSDTLRNLQVLTKAIEQSSSTVVITDVDGNIEYANPKFTETTGYTIEEAKGKNPRILKSGDKPESFYKEMWETLLSGNEWHGEFENVRKNGETYCEHASIASVTDELGKITHFIAVKEDVTERKKILQELEDLTAIQTKLFSVIGHDLRSPLGAIQSMLEIINQREDVEGNEELSKILKIILKSAISVAFLSENLLNWANGWQARNTSHATSFKITEKVDENIELLSSVASQKNIKLISSVDSDMIAYADSDMISVVVRNLIANAIKFTNVNGEIRVSASHSVDNIEIAIQDNGIGIKKELIPVLLDAYDLYSTSGTEREKGSGLGLSICLQFIKLNSGKLSIESELGKGSRFSFTLPVSTPKL